MSGVKTRQQGASNHRYWYEKGTDTRLVRVLRIAGGKKSWFWAIRNGDEYREVPSDKCELKQIFNRCIDWVGVSMLPFFEADNMRK